MDLDDLKRQLENKSEVVYPTGDYDKRERMAETKDENSGLNIPVVIIRCPVCKSEKITDSSTYESNGIIGHGCRSWKTSDTRSCDDCGVIFKPIKGNGL